MQTPTLAIVVAREEEITHFKPQNYWEVHATFGAQTGDYDSVWVDADFKNEGSICGAQTRTSLTAAEAQAIVAKCQGKLGIVTDHKRRATSAPPALFDLTSLQREANGRFGFPAKMTLAILQRLYERHKVLTYPRTDSRALPEDYPETMKETLSHLQKLEAYNAFAGQILMSGWVKGDNRRIFDNKKISDHFAIVPTGELPKDLEETEQKIYDLVVRRTMAAFFPSAVFDVTTRETIVEGEKFVTEGKVLVEPGWMAVVGRAGRTQSDLCPITSGEAVQTKNIAVEADQTRPPARFTDATLLSAMESAGKKLDADELRDAMAEKGPVHRPLARRPSKG